MAVDILSIQLLEQNIRVGSWDYEEAIGVDSTDKEDASRIDSGVNRVLMGIILLIKELLLL